MKVCLCYTTNDNIMASFGPTWGVSLPNRPVRIDHMLEATEEAGGSWKFENADGEGFRIHPKKQAVHNGHLVVTTANSTYIFRIM